MPYNSAHHCVVEVENFLLLLGGEDQWNPNGTSSHLPPLPPPLPPRGVKHERKERKTVSVSSDEIKCEHTVALLTNAHVHVGMNPDH